MSCCDSLQLLDVPKLAKIKSGIDAKDLSRAKTLKEEIGKGYLGALRSNDRVTEPWIEAGQRLDSQGSVIRRT